MAALPTLPQPVEQLTVQSAHIVGNLIGHFSKVNAWGLARWRGGGAMIAFGIDPYIRSLIINGS